MNIRFLIFLFVAFVVGLSSCKNNDEVFKPAVTTSLNIINASADTLNFYLNGTRQNNTSSLITGGQTFYFQVPAGSQGYSFKKIGNPNTLFNLPLTLQDSVNNSLYVTGETASSTFHTVDVLDTSGIGKSLILAKIRFVNASPDAGAVTVSIGDTVSFNSVAFAATSTFQTTGSTVKKEVKLYLPGSLAPKIDTFITVQPAHMYTIFSKGVLNGKGNARFNIGTAINY